jgi:hypothetical protein
MSFMKEVDRIANEIADVLVINPDSVSLSQVPGGWMADVLISGEIVRSETLIDPIKAMEDLLLKARRSRKEHGKLFS